MPSRNWSVRRDSAAAPQALARPVPAIRVRFASNAASSSRAPATRAASTKRRFRASGIRVSAPVSTLGLAASRFGLIAVPVVAPGAEAAPRGALAPGHTDFVPEALG